MARPRTQERKILDALRDAPEGLTQDEFRKLGFPRASVSTILQRLVASGNVLAPTYRLNPRPHWNPEYKIPKKDRGVSTNMILQKRGPPHVEVASSKNLRPSTGEAGARTLEPNLKEVRRTLPVSQVSRRRGSVTASYGKGEVSLTYSTKKKKRR